MGGALKFCFGVERLRQDLIVENNRVRDDLLALPLKLELLSFQHQGSGSI